MSENDRGGNGMSPFFKKRQKKCSPKQAVPESKILRETQNENTSSNLEDNISKIKRVFEKDIDFLIRRFNLFGKRSAALLCMKSLVGKEEIERDIIKPLQEKQSIDEETSINIQFILDNILYYSDTKKVTEVAKLIPSITAGKAVVLIDGIDAAIELDAMKQEKRSITQPETERVVRGPRDGFIEQLGVNIALLRYRLPIPEFRTEQFELGTRTKTKIALCYIDDIVSPALLKEVRSRLEAIQIDSVLDAGYIEEFIQDNPISLFPQIQNSERPDKVVGNLLEGRVGILVEGSPFALIAPATFNQFYQTSEDYNDRWVISSVIRLVRLIALVFSLTFSSLYVTILSFHPELIPASFFVAASSGRQGVPFPVFIEVLFMEIAMEILREATVRMPQQVGGALSIVGVLVVGQAAVQAGFVSPITVVIIALSTIGSFSTPSYNAANAFRMLRFFLIVMAGTLGLLGLAFALIVVVNHMISLRSFGVPYMSPFAPGNLKAMKDSFIRAPFSSLQKRPSIIHPKNVERGGERVEEKTTYNFLNEDGGNKGETH